VSVIDTLFFIGFHESAIGITLIKVFSMRIKQMTVLADNVVGNGVFIQMEFWETPRKG
jgi:hypothetical protein